MAAGILPSTSSVGMRSGSITAQFPLLHVGGGSYKVASRSCAVVGGLEIPARDRILGRKQLGVRPLVMRKADRARSRCGVVVASVAGHADFFETLGVRHGASKSEIKSAYRRLALKYHPDVCKGDRGDDQSRLKFSQINAAYERALAYISGPSDLTYDMERVGESDNSILGDSWEDWEEDLDYAAQVSFTNF